MTERICTGPVPAMLPHASDVEASSDTDAALFVGTGKSSQIN